MRQAVLLGPGRLEVRDVAEPVPGPRDAVVRVAAALTCGTDLKAYRRGHPKMPPPTPFGHEFAGEVVAVGAEVSRFSVGDALMAANTGPCGECFYCKRDQENFCDTIMETMILGAYADYVLVPDRVLRANAFLKPEAMSFERAALLEPLASVCFGLTHIPLSQIRDGATVLIIGAGPIAMLWLLALKGHGASQVVVSGRREPRLAHARDLGADLVLGAEAAVDEEIRELTEGRGADVVVECTGLPEIWEAATTYTRRGGTSVLFGGCAGGSTVTFDPHRLHYDGIRVVSPFHFRPRDVAESHRLLADKHLPWDRLITSHSGLEDVPSLFAELGESLGLKCAVHPDAALPSGDPS